MLDAAVADALEELGGGPAHLARRARGEHPPALQRLILRALAGRTPVTA